MIRKTIIFALLVLMAIPVVAQQKKSKSEMFREFREMKMKYLAQEIELSDDKREEFFTLYGQMEEERHKVFSSTRRLEKEVKEDKGATEADYSRLSEAMTAAKAKDAEITKAYDDKFSKILTAKQLFKMKEAEKTFHEKMGKMRRKSKMRRGK